MRAIPPDMQADLESGLTTHCTCWRIIRADGALFGFTDHDESVDLDGLACRPGAGFDSEEIACRLGLEPGGTRLAGLIEDEVFRAGDFEAGLWDGAEVEIWRVDWRELHKRARIWTGFLGEIEQGRTGFEAGLLGPSARLDAAIGRVFARRCDAALGDARCGVSGDHPEFGQGCDQRFSTCRDRFANTLNFRGFPYLLGDDALMAAPRAAGAKDGGSRGLSE